MGGRGMEAVLKSNDFRLEQWEGVRSRRCSYFKEQLRKTNDHEMSANSKVKQIFRSYYKITVWLVFKYN